MRALGFIVSLCLLASGCSCSKLAAKILAPDRTVVAWSQYPPAIDPSQVGSYSALTKSGAGYFHDDVLEYRVWIHPNGGGDVFYRAFASYEPALQFSKSTTGAEEPFVLVRQRKWINEPEPGKLEPRSDERITEWQIVWLSQNTKRTEHSIERLLKEKAEGASKTEPVATTTSPPNFSPTTMLGEAEALRIGNQFAEEKRWELSRSPTRARFDAARGEWQMFFGIKDRGGPFIVYVNDVTGVVRYVVGE